MTAAQPMIAKRFRRALATYDAEARAQGVIATRLADMLVAARTPGHFDQVLEFGCGTGGLTRQLVKRFRFGTLHLNDLVPEAAARAACAADMRARLLPGPIETLPLPGKLDLVASSATLQWMVDPAALLARLAEALNPGGWLALSGFARGHFRELQAFGIAPVAPGLRDIAEWPALLPPSLEVRALESHDIILEFPDARALLRHLRLTGVNGGTASRWGRRDLARFEAALDKPTLTYQPVWLVAQA